MCQRNRLGCLGGCRLSHPSPLAPSWGHGIGIAPTLGYLCPPSTALKVQQVLQHLKENRVVSRRPEELSHTPRILRANPSNSGIRHHFPGCFSEQKGGESSALLLSLAKRLAAGDEEKHLQGTGSSIPITSGEYLRQGRAVEFMQEVGATTGWCFTSKSPKPLAVGLTI